MKTKIIWFIIGFVVSWLTWSVINYVRFRPRDYTQFCSEEERHVCSWLKSAKGLKLGAFTVLTSSVSSNASAMIYPTKPNHFPQVSITDFDQDGKLDGILIFDSAYHTISVDDSDGDGIFNSYDYTPNGNTLSIRYTDINMDGQYDMRLDPGNDTSSVFIDSQWHDLITKDKGKYIDINGTIKKVKPVDGVWRIIEE
jgi:hypothetical protein